MFAQKLINQFQALGAEARLTVVGDRFQIGIDQGPKGETFRLTLPDHGMITAKIIDLDVRHRHLLLDVTDRRFGVTRKYLCGHDEFHWFVAALRDARPATTIAEAMEALKPEEVRQAQRQAGLKRKQRRKRRTRAYVRQGEWFFLPRPEFDPGDLQVEQGGQLVRGAGKPHQVSRLCRDRQGARFARGRVTHPDHATICLDVWHQVVRNAEAERQPFGRKRGPWQEFHPSFEMTYVD